MPAPAFPALKKARPPGAKRMPTARPLPDSASCLLCGAALAPLALLLPPPAWPAALGFGGLLLGLAWMDLRHGLVHAALVLPLLLLGLLVASGGGSATLAAALAGAGLGYLAFRALEAAYRRLRGQDGLGRGDAWVLGAAGTWTGPGGLPLLVTLAAALALLCVVLRDRGLAAGASFRFVPALAVAAWLVWILDGGHPAWILS
ncbi:prepilin peptidase [Pseudoroseomonas sp. WGS1072]|uniref:prepilin peptidase n=1 Tax=Roseomonas sp. WGS1072 TaxID=3366816 RepID=UPI003BF237A8